MLRLQDIGLSAEPRRDLHSVVEISKAFFESKMGGQLIS